MTPEQREHFEAHRKTLVGDESERECFNNLKRLLAGCDCSEQGINRGQHKCFFKRSAERLRIALFSGVEFLFPDADLKKELVGEFDEVLVVDELKLVIYCELKGTFSKSHALKKQQFGRFKALLENHFPIGEGWRLSTVYGFGKLPGSTKLCKRCSPYVFMMNDFESMRRWFDHTLRVLTPQAPLSGKVFFFVLCTRAYFVLV